MGLREKVGVIYWWTNSFEYRYEATNEAKMSAYHLFPFPFFVLPLVRSGSVWFGLVPLFKAEPAASERGG